MLFNNDQLKECQERCEAYQNESKDSMRSRDRYPYSDDHGYVFEKADQSLFDLYSNSEEKEKI